MLEYRKRLERLTNKQVIPVWHKSRGAGDFKKMCDEYDYVAIGGIVSKEIKPEQYGVTNSRTTHKAKIRALRYNGKCHFDSVDSGVDNGKQIWFYLSV